MLSALLACIAVAFASGVADDARPALALARSAESSLDSADVGLSTMVASNVDHESWLGEDALGLESPVSLLQTAIFVSEEKQKHAKLDLDLPAPASPVISDSTCLFGGLRSSEKAYFEDKVEAIPALPNSSRVVVHPVADADIVPLCDADGEDCDYDESLSYDAITSIQLGAKLE